MNIERFFKTIQFILTNFIFYPIFAILIFMYMPRIAFEYKAKDINFSNIKEETIAIIYDEFQDNDSHGFLVKDTFDKSLKIFKSKNKIHTIILDSNKFKYDDLFYAIDHLGKDKKVYINISFAPKGKIGREYFAYMINKYAKENKNLKFFVAAGNREFLDKEQSLCLKKVNNSGIFDNYIKKQKTFNSLFYKSYSLYFIYRKATIFINNEKNINDEVMDFIRLNCDSNKSKLIYDSIEDFMFTSLLNPKTIKIIAGNDSFDLNNLQKDFVLKNIGLEKAIRLKEKNKNNFSVLDCPIDELQNSNTRETSVYFIKKKDKIDWIVGTSISSPINMAREISKRNK